MKKKIPKGDQGKFVRTGGAIGDLSMEELESFNSGGADVDSSKVRNVGSDGGDPNAGISLGKLPGLES